MSPLDRLKSVKGEAHQGNYLINAKERHSEKKAGAALQPRKSVASSHGVRYTGTRQHYSATTYSAAKAAHERFQ